MQQLPLSLSQMLEIVWYFSALSILIGTILQFLWLLLTDKRLVMRQLLVIGLTQLLAFAATTILWLKWPMGLRILYGPILFPAIIAQLIFVPLIANFFGYRLSRKSKTV